MPSPSYRADYNKMPAEYHKQDSHSLSRDETDIWALNRSLRDLLNNIFQSITTPQYTKQYISFCYNSATIAAIETINTYINKIAADETADIIVHFFAAFAASIASA